MPTSSPLRDHAVIDVHAHVWDAQERIVLNPVRSARGKAYADEVVRRLAGKPTDELTMRLAALDAAGIDLQCLSVTYPHTKGIVADADFCSRSNSMLVEFVGQAPERLRGFAKLDMSDIPGAIKELRRAVTELGLIGPYLTTDFQLDDPDLEVFYDAIEELDVPLFLHGVMPGEMSLLRDARLEYRDGVVGDAFTGRYHLGAPWVFMYEETLAAFTLILSGVLDRHPGLRACISHGGGALAFAAPRLSWSLATHEGTAEHVRNPADFDLRLRRLWVDSDVQSPRNLQFLLDALNPDHIVLGTDFPGWAPHPLYNYPPVLREQLSENARLLLGLDENMRERS